MRQPPLGDIRRMGEGDIVWLDPDAPLRGDWPRYLDALMTALTRGAEIKWVRQ